MLIPKILVWNYRDAGSSNALRHLILLIKINSLDILILSETRCSSSAIDRIRNKSYFNQKIFPQRLPFKSLWEYLSMRLLKVKFFFLNLLNINLFTIKFIYLSFNIIDNLII